MANKQLYITGHAGITCEKAVYNSRELISNHEKTDFKTFSKYLYKSLSCNYTKFYKMDNLCKLAFLSNEFLVRDMDWTGCNKENISVIISNKTSTLDTDISFTDTLDTIPSPAVFVYTLPNIAIGELCIRQGWKGENLFLIEEQFNPKNLLEQTELLFSTTNTELCLSGWIDYISPSEYKSSLWLIAKKKNELNRKLSETELLSDFNF